MIYTKIGQKIDFNFNTSIHNKKFPKKKRDKEFNLDSLFILITD
jgi:hypothetical protein